MGQAGAADHGRACWARAQTLTRMGSGQGRYRGICIAARWEWVLSVVGRVQTRQLRGEKPSNITARGFTCPTRAVAPMEKT